jgi:hypothetical protein
MSMQHATRASAVNRLSRQGFERDLAVLSLSSIVAILVCILLVVVGTPLDALDRWMLLLAVPWFAILYVVSRKADVARAVLTRAVVAAGAAGAAVSYGVKFVVMDIFHIW